MYKRFLILFISCFLISCNYSEKNEELCLSYQDKEYQIQNSDAKSDNVDFQTYDIASFVVEHDLYLKYDFKNMSERYKNLKSTYLEFKVLERLSFDLGFDDGTLYNSYIKDDDHRQSLLEVGVTGQGSNTNYYSSSNSVSNDPQLVENIRTKIQDQLFIIVNKKANDNEINKLVSEFLVKGNCLEDKGSINVIVEDNFNDIHIILESNSANFRSRHSFSFNIHYTKKTDKKYEDSLYW